MSKEKLQQAMSLIQECLDEYEEEESSEGEESSLESSDSKEYGSKKPMKQVKPGMF